MKSLIQRSLLIFIALMLISSTSYANLKKGKVPAGGSKQFSYQPDFNGTNLLTLLYDAASTDLDLIIGDSAGDLVAVSFSPESFSEIMQVGLTNNQTFIVIVDSFEGPTTPFRLVTSSGSQQNLRTATGRENLKEVEMTAAGKRLRDQLRKIREGKK